MGEIRTDIGKYANGSHSEGVVNGRLCNRAGSGGSRLKCGAHGCQRVYKIQECLIADDIRPSQRVCVTKMCLPLCVNLSVRRFREPCVKGCLYFLIRKQVHPCSRGGDMDWPAAFPPLCCRYHD